MTYPEWFSAVKWLLQWSITYDNDGVEETVYEDSARFDDG